MANLQKAVVIVITINADGVNNTFQLNLLKDPYFVVYQGGSNAVSSENLFGDNRLKNQPVGVTGTAVGDTVTLTNNIISYTYGTTPPAGLKEVEFGLLFPA